MSNLLAKWAVKYRILSKIGIVELDGPLITFQCHGSHNAMCSFLDIAHREFTKLSSFMSNRT